MTKMSINLTKLLNKTIPKHKRRYHSYEPEMSYKKLEGWLPKGKIGNPLYENKLLKRAEEIITINEQNNSEPIGVRDWCYLLESLHKIGKKEFKAAQNAFTDMRKLGYIPLLDFFAEDEDDSREFKNIIESTDSSKEIEKMQETISDMKQNLIESNTEFWREEKYFVIVVVEKKSVKNLLSPICKEYHVPIVSTKGFSPLPILGHIAEMSQIAESKGLIPVVLTFNDFDLSGLQMSQRFKRRLKGLELATGWNPSKLITKRIGLNIDTINKYGLTCFEIPNVRKNIWKLMEKYGSVKDDDGHEVKEYLEEFINGEWVTKENEYITEKEKEQFQYIKELEKVAGVSDEHLLVIKCEINALFIDEAHKNIARTLCKEAIEEYYGKDAVERFSKKAKDLEQSSPELYNNPTWKDINNQLETLKTKAVSIEIEKKKLKPFLQSSAIMIEVTPCYVDRNPATCPLCKYDFEYKPIDIEDNVEKACPNCHKPLLLKRDVEASERRVKNRMKLGLPERLARSTEKPYSLIDQNK